MPPTNATWTRSHAITQPQVPAHANDSPLEPNDP